MAFDATKREWSELYLFFKLLADGEIRKGTSGGSPDESPVRTVSSIVRLEQTGIRYYYLQEDHVEIFCSALPAKGSEEPTEKQAVGKALREEFGRVAVLVLTLMREEGERVEASEEIEHFLDRISLYDLRSLSQEAADMEVYFADAPETSVGCTVWSRIGNATRILDGGRTANLKLEQSGAKFSTPEVAKINALETPNTVKDRLLLIEQLGGILKYNEAADKVFRANLAMLDLHMGRLLTEMLRVMHLEGLPRLTDLTQRIKEINPLKVKTELIEKHHYYEYKVKQLLLAAVFGMRPAKIYTGSERTPDLFILLNTDGSMSYYPVSDRNLLGEFLYRNTRLEKTSLEKDKYGSLERENGTYYFKLNLKVGFTKR